MTIPPSVPPAMGSVLHRTRPAAGPALPRIALVTRPTPVHRLPRLGRALGANDLWVKRDDLSAALYAGNKPRKLEYLLGRAVSRGYRSIVTFGALGTNHGLATAVHAAGLGLETILVLVPQPVTPRVVHALQLDRAFGAELVIASGVADAAGRALALLARSWARGRPALLVPPGGSSPLGTVGYVEAGLELEAQVRAGELPEPRALFVAVGSGGTAAGLALGLRLAGLGTQVIGVLVTDILPPSAVRLRRLAHAAGRRAGGEAAAIRLPVGALTLVAGFVGAAYGASTPEATEAVALAERLEGLALETTYTGKCLAALGRLASTAPLRPGPVLFWNTVSSIEPLPPGGRLPRVSELPAPVQRAVRAG